MAEWQYRIERIDLNPETDPDDQLGKILREYGQQGWELVQVLHGQEMPGDPRCRLIFKTVGLKGLIFRSSSHCTPGRRYAPTISGSVFAT